jgi:hypothetical protein
MPCKDTRGEIGEHCSGRHDVELHQQTGFVPPALVSLLEDSNIIKAGVGIYEDVRRLKRDFGICVKVREDVQERLGYYLELNIIC